MRYYIITFGCQMNKNDSQRIAAFLEKIGFKESPNLDNSDLVVVNMCSVRQSAVDRVYGLLPKFEKIKKQKKDFRVIITGCILKHDRVKLLKDKRVDFVLNINLLPIWDKILEKNLNDKEIAELSKATSLDYLKIEPKYKKTPIAYIPIMTGCNNFCTYCVVPYTRGPERSRDPEDILKEVKSWLNHGAKEIWLLGQNVNSYKFKIQNTKYEIANQNSEFITFPKLLRMVNEIDKDFWIRFTSPHPKDLTDELIETMAKCEKVTPYINLPVQSGDNEILKRMNRPYTVEKYKDLIKKLRNAFKKYRSGVESILAISTDVIVGCPNEKNKHFENTKKLFREIKYSMAYIAQFSPRPNTPAYNFRSLISEEEKERREKELTKIVKETALEFNKKFLNKTVNVLVLKEKNGFYFGKTRHYQTIKFPIEENNLIGSFVQVKVTNALDFGLEGKIRK